MTTRHKRGFNLIIIFFILMMNGLVVAEEDKGKVKEDGWQKEFLGILNLTQSRFDNWAQGGEDTLAWQFNLKATLVRDEERYNWSNKGKFSFGRTKMGGKASRKSVDEIRLESVLVYKLYKYVNPYIGVTGETQSTEGYSYTDDQREAISDFMDPGYFKESSGLSYSAFEELKTRLGIAVKETITRNHPEPYANDPDTDETEKTRIEFGLDSVTDLEKRLSERILFTSRLELFSNLKGFDEVDLRWSNILSAHISRYIDINLDMELFYDRDISERRQLKQALTLGLKYLFPWEKPQNGIFDKNGSNKSNRL